MRNLTGYRLRLRNRRLYHRVRSARWWWNAHLVSIARKHIPIRGPAARLMGSLDPGAEPTKFQQLLGNGGRILDTSLTHAVQAYEGSARLLTFRGGEPMPWSAMVLARTAFEASLRVLWIFEPALPDDDQLARIGAASFEILDELLKQHAVLPDEPRKRHEADNDMLKKLYRDALEEQGFKVVFADRGRGYVMTPAGQRAAFPFNVVDAATRWWSPVGVFTYRWLCGFTHASFMQSPATPVPVAALDEANTLMVLHLATDALWKAMDAYSIWVGMPSGIVRHKMSRVFSLIERRLPEGMRVERPPTEIEGIFINILAAMEDTGLMSRRAVDRFARRFIRRLDESRNRSRSNEED